MENIEKISIEISNIECNDYDTCDKCKNDHGIDIDSICVMSIIDNFLDSLKKFKKSYNEIEKIFETSKNNKD